MVVSFEVGQTIKITQDGAEVGADERLKVGAIFYITGHRLKRSGQGSVGVWKLQPRIGKPFETSWLRADIIRLSPVTCPGCGEKTAPYPDGSFSRHGSLGWACDGKTKTSTGL